MQKKLPKIFARVIPFILIFVSLSFIFVGGSFSSQSKMDNIASAQSNAVKENNINYLGLYIEETVDRQLPDHEHEFYENYGVFRQERANYMCAVNIEKEVPFSFKEIEIPETLSMFYFGPIKSAPYVYEGREVYKDFLYPFMYMFESAKIYPPAPYKYVINISQTQADKILEKRMPEKTDKKYTKDDYKSLLQTYTTLSIAGDSDYEFMIGNIFYEANYYYLAAKECLGEFVMVSYFFPKVLTKSNVYLFNEYEFQNNYFMKRILSLYDTDVYELKINHNNLTKKINEELITSFYYKDISGDNWRATFLFFLFGALALISILFICFYFKTYKRIVWWLPLLFSLLSPFIIFKTIFRLTGNILIFSSIATKINFIFVLSIMLIYLVFTIIYFVNLNQKKYIYELNI